MGARLVLVVAVLLWSSVLCISPRTKDGFPQLGALAQSDHHEDDDQLPDLVSDHEEGDNVDASTTAGPAGSGSNANHVLLNPSDDRRNLGGDHLPPATTLPGVHAGLACPNPDYSGPCDPLRMPPEECDRVCAADLFYHHGYCGYIKVLTDISPAWSWACICCDEE